jgi:uncharacterized protein YcfJ
MPIYSAQLDGREVKEVRQIQSVIANATPITFRPSHITQVALANATADAVLATPVPADHSKIIIVWGQAAHANTVTLVTGFNGGGAGADVGTFAAALGGGFIAVACGANVWIVANAGPVVFA